MADLRRGELTRNDADGDVHVNDTVGKGGCDHARADQHPSSHHDEAVTEAVAEHRRQRSWMGRELWSAQVSNNTTSSSTTSHLLQVPPSPPCDTSPSARIAEHRSCSSTQLVAVG